MRIIENNYVPQKKEINHLGYRQVCDHCKSVIVVELEETRYSSYFMGQEYECPCCGRLQPFYKTEGQEGRMG